MTKKTMTPATAIVGAALVGSLGLAQAAENPFAAESLGSGHLQIAEAGGEGKCGEGKCGDGKGAEGKCGGKEAEGEGKCGEGKCGGN